MGRKQADYVMLEDLEEFSELIRADVQNSKSTMSARLDSMQEALTVTLETFKDQAMRSERTIRDKLDSMEEIAKEVTEKRAVGLETQFSDLIGSVKDELHKKIQASQDELQKQHMKDLQDMGERLDSGLSNLRSDLSNQIARLAAESAASDEQERERLSTEADFLQKQIRQLRSEQVESIKPLVAEIEALNRRSEELDLKRQDTAAAFDEKLRTVRGLIKDLEGNCENANMVTRNVSLSSVEKLREQQDVHVKSLEKQMTSLRTSVAETNSIPTRKVEWTLKNISQHFPMQRDRSWLSPKFQLAGARNLQLGVRLLETSLEDGCDCELSLWGHECDLRLVCKLYIGMVSWHCQHTFSEDSPCCLRRMRAFSDQVFCEDEPLRIGVEVLEAIRTISVQEDDEESEVALAMHQYINHSLLDAVQEQVDRMRSRMTRRVEWRLEQASCLRQCFAEGESLCSSTFMAAGLEGLQLVFYPSGYTGAKDLFCSLFLYYPGGATLRCWLSAGKQRREARIAFVEQPGFFGRTNFCRFDGCIDADDSLLLALEIEEVESTASQNLSHSIPQEQVSQLPPPQDSAEAASEQRPPSRPAGARSATPNTLESVVKLQRLPGRVALEDVRQLPSIWTPMPVANVGEVLEGFHRFSDMRPRTPRKQHPAPRKLRYGGNDLNTVSFLSSGFEALGPSLASSRAPSRNDAKVIQKYMPYAQ